MKAFFSKYRQYVGLAAALALVGVDQLTKWLAEIYLPRSDAVNLISINGREVLNFYYCTNNGSAFSMMQGKTGFLITVTAIIIATLVFGLLSKKVKRVRYVISFSLIIGGGLGNLIDRVFRNGNVIDFIDVRIIDFPIFNFADICAVIGGIMLCVFVAIDETREAKKKKQAKVAEGTDEENGND